MKTRTRQGMHLLLAPQSRAPLLTRAQAAQFCGCSVSLLEKLAGSADGPRYFRNGLSQRARTRYRVEDLEDFAGKRWKSGPSVQLIADGTPIQTPQAEG